MLFCRIVASRERKNFDEIRKMVIESTATGIDALTVNPTLSTRYNDDAPKMIPRIVPVIRCGHVNSGKFSDAGMKGVKLPANGLVGRAPTMSGYSCGGFALSIVDILQELERMGQSTMALQHA